MNVSVHHEQPIIVIIHLMVWNLLDFLLWLFLAGEKVVNGRKVAGLGWLLSLHSCQTGLKVWSRLSLKEFPVIRVRPVNSRIKRKEAVIFCFE